MALASSTLDDIRQRVRQTVRAPSENQLSTVQLDQFINTALAYNMPNIMRLFSLRTVFTFYTQPGQDVYQTITDPTQSDNPLYDFQNKYTAIHPTAYIAGVPAFFTEERGVFYGNWPQTNTISNTGLRGNGTIGPFVGIIPTFSQQPTPITQSNNTFILKGSVMFSALDTNNVSMQIVDYPLASVDNNLGVLGLPNSTGIFSSYGFINYLTGAFSVTFPRNTVLGTTIQPNPIWVEYIAYVSGIPTTMLYYNNQFTLRPVPDKAYVVQVEADMQPIQLLQGTDSPQIKQWWEYIAAMSSLKIFEVRMDSDSMASLQPIIENYKEMVLSTSMEQYTNQRTITIYTQNGASNTWPNFGLWPY
jgi:hypothetical protein